MVGHRPAPVRRQVIKRGEPPADGGRGGEAASYRFRGRLVGHLDPDPVPVRPEAHPHRAAGMEECVGHHLGDQELRALGELIAPEVGQPATEPAPGKGRRSRLGLRASSSPGMGRAHSHPPEPADLRPAAPQVHHMVPRDDVGGYLSEDNGDRSGGVRLPPDSSDTAPPRAIDPGLTIAECSSSRWASSTASTSGRRRASWSSARPIVSAALPGGRRADPRRRRGATAGQPCCRGPRRRSCSGSRVRSTPRGPAGSCPRRLDPPPRCPPHRAGSPPRPRAAPRPGR